MSIWFIGSKIGYLREKCHVNFTTPAIKDEKASINTICSLLCLPNLTIHIL